MKKHNFSAGPSILPKEVINESSKSVAELDTIGLSLIEISHRSKEFISIMNEAQSLVLKLLELDSSDYKVLFLQGGASMQFLMTAINLLDKRAGFINTGSWSQKTQRLPLCLLGKAHKSLKSVLPKGSNQCKPFSD